MITGGVNDIRKKYGNNNIELEYTGDKVVVDADGIFTVVSDEVKGGKRDAVLALEPEVTTNQALQAIIGQEIPVSSFRELMPRMNDIFIKLVTEEA